MSEKVWRARSSATGTRPRTVPNGSRYRVMRDAARRQKQPARTLRRRRTNAFGTLIALAAYPSRSLPSFLPPPVVTGPQSEIVEATAFLGCQLANLTYENTEVSRVKIFRLFAFFYFIFPLFSRFSIIITGARTRLAAAEALREMIKVGHYTCHVTGNMQKIIMQ